MAGETCTKSRAHSTVRLLLSYPTGRASQGGSLEIPDPWYGDEAEFESCLDLVQAGCAALLGELAAELATRLRPSGRGAHRAHVELGHPQRRHRRPVEPLVPLPRERAFGPSRLDGLRAAGRRGSR